jgi:hypothetical protein
VTGQLENDGAKISAHAINANIISQALPVGTGISLAGRSVSKARIDGLPLPMFALGGSHGLPLAVLPATVSK